MRNTENFWDRAASTYDREEGKDNPTYITMIEKTRKYLEVGDMVLDFGCGTGGVSSEISGSVHLVHAVDTSSKMIEFAKQKAEQRKIDNILYAHATIFDERYPRGAFDVIMAFYILHLVDDTQGVMQRIYELLKPGGLLISATPCMGEKALLRTLLSLFSKIGLTPKLRSFKYSELKELIASESFEIVAADCLEQDTGQYFIVAKKM